MIPVPLALAGLDPDLIDLVDDLDTFALVGVFDKDPDRDTGGVAHLGDDDAWSAAGRRHPGLRVVVTVDTTDLRAALAARYGRENLATVVAPDAHVSPSAAVGSGCILQRGVKVLRGAIVGEACKLNVDAVVHHDCRVGDFCTLAPGARLLGAVELGERVLVGAGAIVLAGLRIGAGATIGAGAVVTRNVPSDSRVAGVPAQDLDGRAPA